MKGLGEMVPSALKYRGRGRCLLTRPGARKYPRLRIDLSNSSERRMPILNRHGEVERRQVRPKRRESLDRRISRGRLASDLVASGAEDPPDHDSHELGIVSDEDGRQVASFVGVDSSPQLSATWARELSAAARAAATLGLPDA